MDAKDRRVLQNEARTHKTMAALARKAGDTAEAARRSTAADKAVATLVKNSAG